MLSSYSTRKQTTKLNRLIIACFFLGLATFFSIPMISWAPLGLGIITVILGFVTLGKGKNSIEQMMNAFGFGLGIIGIILFWLTPMILRVLWK